MFFPVGLACLIAAQFAVAQSAAVTCDGTENTALAATTPTADFTDNNDGTVTDDRTGLVWMRCSLGQSWDGNTCTGIADGTLDWQSALQEAGRINDGSSNSDNDGQAGFAGWTDWRLPSKNELASIIERRCAKPAINGALFPNVPMAFFNTASWYWTSSPDAGTAANAWYIDFAQGSAETKPKNTNSDIQVRLVRGGR